MKYRCYFLTYMIMLQNRNNQNCQCHPSDNSPSHQREPLLNHLFLKSKVWFTDGNNIIEKLLTPHTGNFRCITSFFRYHKCYSTRWFLNTHFYSPITITQMRNTLIIPDAEKLLHLLRMTSFFSQVHNTRYKYM